MIRTIAIGLMLVLLTSGCATMKAYEGPELTALTSIASSV